MSERRLRSQLYYAQDEISRLRAKLERAREGLEAIKRYDENTKYGVGVCPYGCDTPNIARETLRELENGGGE